MTATIKIADKEYDVKDLSEKANNTLQFLEFTNKRLEELSNMRALLNRAKNSYAAELKKEIISKKAGFSLDDT